MMRKLCLPALVLVACVFSLRLAAAQGMLDPTQLTKFIDPLPIPAVVQPTGVFSGTPYYDVTLDQMNQQLHSQLAPTPVWGYNQSYPGPSFVVRSGQPVTVKFTSNLPTEHLLVVDTSIMGAEPPNPEVRTVIHLHGGSVPPEYDGWPEDWFVPGGSQTCEYPNGQDAATLWYHDHAMGITRLNTIAGFAGFYIVTDPVDSALNLPSGPYDIGLALQDRKFYDDGSLYYPAQWTMTFYGDVALVNGKIWPRLEVEPRKYRFRFLEGSTCRYYDLKLLESDSLGHVQGDSVGGPAFNVIASDQGLLEHPVKLNDPLDPASRRLSMAPGERYDVVIDFAGLEGRDYLLHNDAPAGGCCGGRRGGGMRDSSDLPEIMLFHVKDTTVTDPSSLPGFLRSVPRTPESLAVQTRDITLGMQMMGHGRMMMLLNDMMWDDPVMEMPMLGSTEIWRMINLTSSYHPMHLHLVKFQVLDRRPFDMMEYRRSGQIVYTGPAEDPSPEEMGWKDTYICPPGYVSRLITTFKPYSGMYVYHCHMLEHEDNAMMRPYEVMDDAGLARDGLRPVAEPLLGRITPSPARRQMTVEFALPGCGQARLAVYNSLGAQVRTLAAGEFAAGSHRADWDATDDAGVRVAAGTYFCRLTTTDAVRIRKVTLLR